MHTNATHLIKKPILRRILNPNRRRAPTTRARRGHTARRLHAIHLLQAMREPIPILGQEQPVNRARTIGARVRGARRLDVAILGAGQVIPGAGDVEGRDAFAGEVGEEVVAEDGEVQEIGLLLARVVGDGGVGEFGAGLGFVEVQVRVGGVVYQGWVGGVEARGVEEGGQGAGCDWGGGGRGAGVVLDAEAEADVAERGVGVWG